MNLYEHLNSMNQEDELKVPSNAPVVEPVVESAEPTKAIEQAPVVQKDYRTPLMKQIEAKVEEQRNVLDTPYYLTPEESKVVTQAMTDAIDNGEDPSQVKEMWSQAIAFSRQYDLPLSATINSLDALTEYQLGAKPNFTQTGTRAVLNSMKIGSLTVDRAELAEKFHDLYRKGQDTSEIEAQIQALDEQIESLRDYMPRNIVTRILKAAGNSAAYSINVLGASLASQYLGGLVTSTLGLTGPLATAITAAGGFLKGRQLTKYSKYYDLIKAGVDPTAAEWTSELSADIQAAIEAYLGIESRLAKGIAGGTSALSRRIVENMFINGGMDKVASMASKAATFGIGYGVNLASEFTEEWSQQITEMVFDNMAYTLSEMDAPYSIEDINKEALSAGIEGALAAVITGVGESVTSTSNTIKKATELKHLAATTPSVEEFVKKAEEVAPDFVAKDKFESAMTSIWEQTQNQASQIKAEQSVESTGMANFLASSVEGAEVSEDSVVFSDEKSLTETLSSIRDTATSVVKENDGTYRLTFTDKDGNNEQISFMTKEQAASQNRETNIPFAEGYDEKVRFRGAQLSEEAFLQEEERNYVREGIKNMLGKNASPGLVNSGTESVLVASRMLGIPSDTLIDKKIGINFIEETVNDKGQEFKGYMDRGLKDGGTFFNINVNKNADTTTLPHEIGHVVRALSDEKTLSSFAKRYGGTVGAMWVEDIKQADGKYIVGDQVFDNYDDAFALVSPNEEKFVDEFLQYLATGVAPTEEARSIFSQMKQFLKSIVDEYGDNFDPDVKADFDNMLRNPSSVESSESGRLFQLSDSVESIYKSTLEKLKNNPANWDGEHWLAPNGKISNLTERQYVQVRTPNFINWFGEWLKLATKKNLNKVIASVGENIIHGDSSAQVRGNAIAWVEANIKEPIPTKIGSVIFNGNSINDSLSHGYGKTKLDSIPSIPNVLKEGAYLGNEMDNSGASIRNHYFAGLVQFTEGEKKDNKYVFVRVREASGDNGRKRFYVHEVFTEDKIKEASFQTASAKNSKELRGRPLYLNILSEVLSVKEEDVSKIIDENGEPKVVYHGTGSAFTVFSAKKTNTPQFWFTDNIKKINDGSIGARGRGIVVEAFLNIKNPAGWEEEDKYGLDQIKTRGFDGKDLSDDGVGIYVAFEPNQIKSATSNVGSFSSANPSILYQLTNRDRQYFDALKAGDMNTAQAIVDESASQKGYTTDSSYQGTSAFNGVAPSSNAYYDTKEERRKAFESGEAEGDWSLGDYADGYDPMNIGLFLTNPNMARTDFAKESVKNLKKGVKDRVITMYRSVPKSINEGFFRNGDWITPSKKYAIDNAEIHGWEEGYKIIEQEVSIDDIWWDGNDINEWGYDDGKAYAYQNTENNVKSIEVITRDEYGNIIPPSQRFNKNEPSRLYQLSDAKKKEILDQRKTDVQNATFYGFIVPTKILEEYAGEDWADEELEFRKKFAASADLARKAFTRAEEITSTPNEDDYTPVLDENMYLDAVEEMAKEEGIDFNRDEESYFWKKIFNYAQQAQETPTARDRKFAAQYARTDAQILNLAKRLANYTDVRTRIRKVNSFDLKQGGDFVEERPYQAISNVWGAFPGVSTKLLRLNKDSSQEQIAQVREMIAKNPRPYREALDKVMLAEERVDTLKHPYSQHGISLEATLFYQGLGDMMDEQFRLAEKQETEREEYLNAQMTPEESKELKLEKEALEETKKELQGKVSDLEKQVTRAKANADYQWRQFKNAEKEAEELGNLLKDSKSENKILNKTLESVRARRDEYRKQATEARKEVDSLNGKLDTARRRLEAQINRINRKKLINNLKKWTTFNPDTELVDFADSLTFLNRIAKDDRYAALLEMPSELLPYISDELYNAISLGRPLSDWSDSELQSLAEAAVMIRNDARQAKEYRDYARKARLNNETYEYYKQTYGVDGALRDGQMNIRELTEQMKRVQESYDNAHKKGLAKMKNTIKDAIIKPQRLARQLDSDSEGIVYNRFVRQAWWNYQLEKANEDRRFEAYKAKAKELGITEKHLSEKNFATYRANGDGETISLTRGQAIGVYVYSQNIISARKLGAVGGNQMGMDGVQMNQIIDKLSDNDKAWGDYLIDELGGDATWERMNEVYRTVYNRQLGRRNRYFTFVADGTNYQGSTDLLQGPQGNPVAYTDKGMTKEIDEHATYPLDLDVSKTYLAQVARQEHFIAWAGWVRDSNYQLNDNFGGMGSVVSQKFGSQAKKTLQTYVNDVARPNQMMTDIEKLYSKALSNYAVASLAGNFMTIIKQAPSIASALRGDIGFTEFVTAGQRLISDRKATLEFINSKTTDIKNRVIDQELSNFRNYTELGLAENVLSKTANILMKPTQFVDKAVVSQMWLAAYETGIHNGLTEDEAVFKASQLINETQPTSGAVNLSELQRNSSPFVRAMIMFTNQIMNVMNQLWFDLPYFAKTHNVRKFIGTAANIALSAGAMVALSGAFLEDDKEKRRKKVWQSIISQIATYSVPIFGSAIGETYSKGDLISLPGAIGDFARSFANTEDDYWAKVGKEAWDLVVDSAKAAGVPTTPIKRAVDSVENGNPFYMFGTSIGEGTDKIFE